MRIPLNQNPFSGNISVATNRSYQFYINRYIIIHYKIFLWRILRNSCSFYFYCIITGYRIINSNLFNIIDMVNTISCHYINICRNSIKQSWKNSCYCCRSFHFKVKIIHQCLAGDHRTSRIIPGQHYFQF